MSADDKYHDNDNQNNHQEELINMLEMKLDKLEKNLGFKQTEYDQLQQDYMEL